jgi:hypothetical protein
MSTVAGPVPVQTVALDPKASARAPKAFTFRLVPAIDTSPRLVAWAQTRLGKVLLLSLFAAGLRLRFDPKTCLAMTAILAATTFLPNHRRWVVTAGTLLWLGMAGPGIDWTVLRFLVRTRRLAGAFDFPLLQSVVLVAVLVLSALGISFARRYPGALPFRRPVLTLAIFYAISVIFASRVLTGRIGLIAWMFVFTLGAYFWFLGYALVDARARDGDSVGRQLGAFHPFWGSTTTPVPKGAAYLRRIECKAPQELAVTQLKGLKLLAWAWILYAASLLFAWFAHVALPVPSYQVAFNSFVAGQPFPWYVCWLSLVTVFVESLLSLAIWGHAVIACCRMAGFRALRNTYRPLEARTIAEFWNRYYFYFKELLVDFFFYPTFFRWLKRRPRLRLAAATFAAAGFGNMFFHFIRDIGYVATLGMWQALLRFQVYAFYCFVLSAGIVVSQLRNKARRKTELWFRSPLFQRFGVVLFYCLLEIFDDTGRSRPVTTHFAFLLHLFGIGR